MVEKESGIKVLEVYTQHMPVDVTPERRRELQAALVRCTREERQLEKDKKDAAERFKNDIAVRQIERQHAADALHTGKEMQPVQLRKEVDHVKGCLRTVRISDGVILQERPLLKEELEEARKA